MPRTQVNYSPTPENLQVTASPNITTEQTSDDPRASKAFRLAESLGVAAPQIEQAHKRAEESEREAATQYANSMTVDELGKMVKEGKILPSQSPLYVATVQHIYGENLRNQTETDVTSKLSRGELSFQTPEELDKYLSDTRNELLSGQSKYTLAGFDKGWGKMKDTLITANTRKQDKEFVEFTAGVAGDNLVRMLDIPEESTTIQAGKIVERYGDLRKAGVYSHPDAGKAALKSVLAVAAEKGNKTLVEEIVKAKLSDGQSVAAVIGHDHAVAFVHKADVAESKAQHEKVNREILPFLRASHDGTLNEKEFEEWFKKNPKVSPFTYDSIIERNKHSQERIRKENEKAVILKQSQDSVATAQQHVAVAVGQGAFAFLPKEQLKILSPTGEVITAPAEEYAKEVLRQREQNEKWNLAQSVYEWSRNGVKNDAWKSQIDAGLSNMASLGWEVTGKPVGQLDKAGEAGLGIFMQINKVNPQYARDLVGDHAKYEKLSKVQMAYEMQGAGNLHEAARLVNEASRTDIDRNLSPKLNKLEAAVDEITNPGVVSRMFDGMASLFVGGNTDPNLSIVRGWIKNHAELLVRGGYEPEEAIKMATTYLANPQVSTQINGVVYLNSQLPRVPDGEDRGYWMERFKKEVPSKVLEYQGVSPKHIVLWPTQNNSFIVKNMGGFPMADENGNVIQYTAREITEFALDSMKADRQVKADKANYENYKARIQKELKKAQSKDKYFLEKYDPVPYHHNFNDNILSEDAYNRILRNGHANKPLTELMQLYKAQ